MCRASQSFNKLIGLFPFDDFRFVDAVFVRVEAAGYPGRLLILGVSTRHFEAGHAIDDVYRKTVAIGFVANRQLNGVTCRPPDE